MPLDSKQKRVTATAIESWQGEAVRDRRRINKTDSDVTGLEIRVQATGKVCFKLRYRMPGDTNQRAYGIEAADTTTLEQARTIARAAWASIKACVDPHDRDAAAGEALVASKRASAGMITVEELANEWLKNYAAVHRKPGTVAINRLQLAKDVVPEIGGMKAADVTKRDIARVANRGVDRGALISSNRTVELVRAIFEWGIGEDHVKVNPAKGFNLRGKENARKRVLSDDELREFWRLLPEAGMSTTLQLALKLALLTGQRISNCTGAERREINTKARTWTIPWRKVKDRREEDGPHIIPLSALAMGVVLEALNAGDSKYLFPSPRGDVGVAGHAAATGLRRAQGHFGFGEAFTPHDLRRTAGTGMARLKVPTPVIGHVLAHREVTHATVFDCHYNQHDYLSEKREALDLWADHVAGIVGVQTSASTESSNVVALKSA